MLSEELPASLHVRPLADSIGSESQNPSISGFGTELIFNALMLEVWVSLIVQKL
jgi:hypothetical protein